MITWIPSTSTVAARDSRLGAASAFAGSRCAREVILAFPKPVPVRFVKRCSTEQMKNAISKGPGLLSVAGAHGRRHERCSRSCSPAPLMTGRRAGALGCPTLFAEPGNPATVTVKLTRQSVAFLTDTCGHRIVGFYGHLDMVVLFEGPQEVMKSGVDDLRHQPPQDLDFLRAALSQDVANSLCRSALHFAAHDLVPIRDCLVADPSHQKDSEGFQRIHSLPQKRRISSKEPVWAHGHPAHAGLARIEPPVAALHPPRHPQTSGLPRRCACVPLAYSAVR